MSVVHITSQNFREEVVLSDQKVLLDFWAPWCGPCRMVSPVLEEIAASRPDIKIAKVNVDEEMELASQFRVASIPRLVVLEKGNILRQSVGARPKHQILDLIDG